MILTENSERHHAARVNYTFAQRALITRVCFSTRS